MKELFNITTSHLEALPPGTVARLNFLTYAEPRNTAIQLTDPTTSEPLLTVTSNTPVELPPGHIAVKNYSENTGILEDLIINGITSQPVGTIATGYTKLHIVKLLINPVIEP